MSKTIEVSLLLKELAAIFREQHQFESVKPPADERRVQVHQTISKFAYFYEKFRNAIDYQEDHLIRKNAIARILKRRFMTRGRQGISAELFIRELIRGGYLPNDYFPERRLSDVAWIIQKYLILIDQTTVYHNFQEKNSLYKWIISVAAFELEEYISPSIKEDAVVEAMYKVVRQQINLETEVPRREDQDIQVYIAIHRALIKSDQAMLRYHLLYYYAPAWRYMTTEDIKEFSSHLPGLIKSIERQISNKANDQVYRHIKKFAPIFTVLRDILKNYPTESAGILADPETLERAVREVCNWRYREASARLSRGIVRSIIYIFLTKIILAFVLELPYDLIFVHQVNLFPLAVNVIFPPLLMFLVAASIRVPAEQNTQMILGGIRELVYDLPEKTVLWQDEITFKKRTALGIIFSAVYSVAFILTFGLIIWGLRELQFNLISGFLFIFFLSIISFFGLRLRTNAKELVMVARRENLIMILFDFFTLPVLRAGRWIAGKTSKINIFMFVLDFIIEAPFKVLIEIAEEWVAYQRRKKEEIF